jgi:hypothetical protein
MGVPVERFGQIADIGDSRNPLPPLSGAGREVRCRLLALLTGPPVRWSFLTIIGLDLSIARRRALGQGLWRRCSNVSNRR